MTDAPGQLSELQLEDVQLPAAAQAAIGQLTGLTSLVLDQAHPAAAVLSQPLPCLRKLRLHRKNMPERELQAVLRPSGLTELSLAALNWLGGADLMVCLLRPCTPGEQHPAGLQPVALEIEFLRQMPSLPRLLSAVLSPAVCLRSLALEGSFMPAAAAWVGCTQLQQLTALTLDCGFFGPDNWRQSLPALLQQASSLLELSLIGRPGRSNLGTLPPDLAAYCGLTRLVLRDMMLMDLPEGPYLQDLESLDLFGNELPHLPPSLTAATSLTHLSLTGNCFLHMILPDVACLLALPRLRLLTAAGVVHDWGQQKNERSSVAAPSTVYRTAVKPFKPAAAAPARRRRSLRPRAALSVDQQPPAATTRDRSHETDVVIIGSGIGGLCCAALLARYGFSVTVLESHYHAGGAAHSFEVQGYSFDAGPSFFAGLSGPPGSSKTNPLKLVLDAVGESVECVTYKKWIVYQPNGRSFECVCDAEAYAENIRREGGEEAYRQWKELERLMQPLQEGAAMLPAAALRADPGIALTAGRFGPGLLKAGLVAGQLTGPFSALVDKVVTNPWLRSFLDLECFILSGMTAKDTICAEMAFMFGERHSGETTIDYPVGGSKAIVEALVRGIEKHGGRVLLRSHVEQVLVEGGRAAGVRLRGSGGSGGRPEIVRAKRAVVSNASVWDTMRLLPQGAVSDDYRKECTATPRTGSFVHLHLGIDATGLPADLECHHLLPNEWGNFEAPQNVINVSIPTVFDPSLAPPGKHLIHAYTAGNEPYELWEGVKRGTPEYAALKEERSQCLWAALEKIIPDVRIRAELALVGTPLTHERFLRRYKGTYGPAISAADSSFPGPGTLLPGLLRCGDSCAPGIGVPAAAASGMIAANTLAPVWSHWQLLDALGL
ncbi:hypothetical protein COHA_008541 [Chlorella ohadii]|uniref:Amine oxidase domain-containing protein n=1 Tax=Chlorella ohadii TaxID=2649997 RepID=A0AAD5DL69_9CHLO|nr:hypothetical protein COHA_008541 [Chlorella ohadii]